MNKGVLKNFSKKWCLKSLDPAILLRHRRQIVFLARKQMLSYKLTNQSTG